MGLSLRLHQWDNCMMRFLGRKLNLLVFFGIFFYVVVACVVSVNRYWQFQSFYFDFGIVERAIYEVAHFRAPIVDHPAFGYEQKWMFADHFNPSLYLLSPLYWFTDRREVLLIAQSVMAGVSAWVGYLIARERIKNKLGVLAVLAAYLGYVGLQNALITEFHDATLATLPLMLCFYFATRKRWREFYVCLIILLGLKETFAGLGVGIGVYLLLVYRRQYLRAGIMTILISLLWGLVAVKVIIPYFLGGDYIYTNLGIPDTLSGLLVQIFQPEVKFRTVFYSFASFGFLPLIFPPILPAIAENFLERFITSSSSRWDLGFHYNAPVAVLMFVGAVYSMARLEKRLSRKLIRVLSAGLILVVLVLHRFVLRGPLQLFFNPVFYQQRTGVFYVEEFLDAIPRDGLIMTQNDLALRLTHDDVVLLREDYERMSPSYIALNLTPGQNANSFHPLKLEEVVEIKDELLVYPN